jgi:transposase
MPATVIAERISWERSLTVLKVKVRELRPLFAPPDPASQTQYMPGELAQCDLWFPPADVPLGAGQLGRPPVLVMVAGYSRVMTARVIPSRQAPDLLARHWALTSGLGAVPRALVWDNESAVGQWRGGRPVLTEAMNGSRGMLGITVIQCRPVTPKPRAWSSGPTDTWRPRSCLAALSPARRTSTPSSRSGWPGPTPASTAGWGARAADRWDADKAAMVGLPPVVQVTGWRLSTRPRDYYVPVDSNDYSVDPSVIGRTVEVAAGLDEVTVTCQGRLAARHPRCWAAHQSITDPAHAAAAAQLRQARRHYPPG